MGEKLFIFYALSVVLGGGVILGGEDVLGGGDILCDEDILGGGDFLQWRRHFLFFKLYQ